MRHRLAGRLVGQSTGAALVAVCFAISQAKGLVLALALGGAFAGIANFASLLRLSLRVAPAPPA